MIVYVAESITGIASYELSFWRASIDHSANVSFDPLKWDKIGSNFNVINITYAELKALKNNSELVSGQKYQITDYASAYNIFDGGDGTIIEEQVGALEPLILTAISITEFDKVAISPLHPKDIIHYSLDVLDIRDIGFSNGKDIVIPKFKGQIYFREDTEQNVSTHYDFRNVKFRRWAVDCVVWTATSYKEHEIIKSVSDGKIYNV
jgi:hypothetical protein